MDGRTLQYEGEEITVGRFQKMAQVLAADTEGWIDKLIGGKWSGVRKTILLRDIADNLVYEGPGRSFATNRKNSWLAPGASRMVDLVGDLLFRETKTRSGRGCGSRQKRECGIRSGLRATLPSSLVAASRG
ncbi:hypothetical protein HIM_09932 [Hirsutella minnesotensis 3608]|uniref:Uncharacterized protein n=1 Tax=Hirsutella minnesotensis 3608 TaxID=1043627 RepID=A0A0F8A2S8_9HYPO|nr:hypothetical protein HIM_09932 [Hirsutella minnesotensis 3608]